MKLNDLERAMRAGELGRVAQLAIEHQIRVGEFFGAPDFVPVTQAHVMADTESLGEAGVAWLESVAEEGGKVRVPTITDPRGTDFARTAVLKHPAWIVEIERRAVQAFTKLGVMMTDTCINYQTIQAPARGESLAFGDTGVVIYANSVCGARSNYEGGPSALAAGLTGRTPRYGFHLDAQRRATLRIRVDWAPQTLNEWGALGGLIGRLAGNYDRRRARDRKCPGKNSPKRSTTTYGTNTGTSQTSTEATWANSNAENIAGRDHCSARASAPVSGITPSATLAASRTSFSCPFTQSATAIRAGCSFSWASTPSSPA